MTEPSGRERTVRLVRAPTAEEAGVFCIQDAKNTVFYAFREIPCTIGGRGFAVHKLGLGTLYHVRVGRRQDSSCECLGFLAHGICRHILALRALIDARLV
jgi:hypothetical protein